MGSYLFTEFISAQQPPSTSPIPNFLNPKGSLVFIAWQYRHPALQFYFFLKKKKKKALQFHFFFIIIIIIYACVQLQRLQKVFKRTAILNFKLALSHCHGTREKKRYEIASWNLSPTACIDFICIGPTYYERSWGHLMKYPLHHGVRAGTVEVFIELKLKRLDYFVFLILTRT